MDKIIQAIKEENKGYTLYWEFNYQSNTGWKRKYLFGTIKDLNSYMVRYHQDKKTDFTNLSLNDVKILETMYPKLKFNVLK